MLYLLAIIVATIVLYLALTFIGGIVALSAIMFATNPSKKQIRRMNNHYRSIN